MRSLLALLVVVVVLALPASGLAAFGDDFGLLAINDHPDAVDVVPALPGVQEAFWAGTCVRAQMPAVGEPLAGTAAVGVAPDTVFAPSTFTETHHVPVPAPAVSAHCVDWGAPLPVGTVQDGWMSGDPIAGWVVPPDGRPPSWRLGAVTQAGAHPDASSMMALHRSELALAQTEGHVDNVVVDLPAGFVGNPQAVPQCTAEQFAVKPSLCPPESQVGVLNLHMSAPGVGANFGVAWDGIYPVWNLEPRKGRVAELGFAYASGESATTVRLTARVRTGTDFGVSAFVGQIPASLPLNSQAITLWGVPWAAENDLWRAQVDLLPGAVPCSRQPETATTSHYIPPGGLSAGCQARYEAGWGEIRPFLVNETDCNPAPTTRLWMDTYQNPASFDVDGRPVDHPNWVGATSVAPAVTGCGALGFDPGLQLSPTAAAADAPSGLSARLELAQNDDPPAAVAHDPGDAADPDAGAPGHWRSAAGLATGHLRDTVVTLPAGMSVNPSGAAGLAGCTDAQIGLLGVGPDGRPRFNGGDPYDKDGGADGAECPDAAKIGTATVHTPLLADPLTGEVVLGQPKSTDPTSGEMFRLFLVVRDRERGLVAKIFGSAVANPVNGQLTTTFRDNPEVPFDSVELDIKGGQRALLATPATCAARAWSSSLTPWSGPQATALGGQIVTDTGCGFAFSPVAQAGTTDRAARAFSPFALRLVRPQGQQTISDVTVAMPEGLLASLRGIPLCSDTQAAANACPAGSRVGAVDATAGSGTPFALERDGDVYLTGPYKGAPYGLAITVPVEAGPFRDALALTPIVVRAALHVDRTTAQVTAVTDPLPRIHHGIPLRVREIVTAIDRPHFTLNPSDCSPKQIQTTLTSHPGATTTKTTHYQAADCARLPFEPRLRLRLTGRRQVTTGRHPGVRALVRQTGVGEAGIAHARVVLPKSLALDPDNARTLCEFDDGSQPNPEDHCPTGSIIGRARANTPLLNRPLTGPVFFVKNVRIDPRTGNAIRTLPKLVVALRGEIAINLQGTSSVNRTGKLVNTFKTVPDAPITRFAMRLKGGRNGILVVTRTRRSNINICRQKQTATTRFKGHNNKPHRARTTINTPCPKKGKTKRKKRNKRR